MSFLSWLLWGYIIWLFIAKAPSGASWAAEMGKMLTGRDVCGAASTTAAAASTSSSPTSGTATAGNPLASALANALTSNGTGTSTPSASNSSIGVSFPDANYSSAGVCTTNAAGVKSCT